MRWLIALVVLLGATHGASALAQHPPVSSFCQYGAAVPDGCGQSAEVQFGTPSALIHTNFFTGYAAAQAGSPTNYASTRPPVNMSCVDYHCGAYTPISQEKDPISNPPPGCTPGTRNPGSQPTITCGGSSYTGIIGYNFGAQNGHGCVIMNMNTTPVTAPVITIADNYFTNDGNCGNTANQEYMVIAWANGMSFATHILYNTFQGNGTTFPYNTCNGTADGGATCNGASAISMLGPVTVEYNSFVDFAGRSIYFGFSSAITNTLVFKYNYVEGWDYHPFNGHTEFIVTNGNSNGNGSVDYEYNTILETTAAMNYGPSPFFLASTWPVDYTGGINLTGNTVIGSLVGNASYSATVSGCIGGNSSCNTPGSNFYVSSISPGSVGTGAAVGHGEGLGGSQGGPLCTVNAGGANVFAWIDANIGGGTGVGSSWTLDSSTLPPTLWSSGPATCSGLLMWSPSANTGVVQGNSYIRNISQITLLNNYIDGATTYIPRNGSGTQIFAFGGNGVSFNGTISGTALTINSGSNPSIGEYVVGAGVSGCTSNPTTCPTIASGTAPNFTLSFSGGTVGPESMFGELPTVCGSPANVGGNVDMAGLGVNSVMNPSFAAAPFSTGC